MIQTHQEKFCGDFELNTVNTFDLDGCIYLGEFGGVYPGPNDFIITGRSIEEAKVTFEFLKKRGIHNQVFFNCIPFEEKTRVLSGQNKGRVIKMLIESGYNHGVHFDDDDIQIAEIKKIVPNVRIVHIVSDLTEKENVRYHCGEKK